jgi:DUF4097 and DUF4098 domain-containing protein YvlB
MTTTQLTFRALLLVGALPLTAAAQRDGDRIDTTLTITPGGMVSLSTISGEVRIRGESRADVHLRGEIERGSFDRSYTRSRISVTTRSENGRQSGARMDVAVPKGTRVNVRTVSGRVEVEATEGEVTVNTTSGSIEVKDARDQVVLTTVSGSLELSRARGLVQMDGVSSTLRIDDVAGELTAETVSGSIIVRRGNLNGAVLKAMSGGISYEGAISRTGVFRFNTHSGSVSLTFPADVGANLELETFSGRINSDFPLTMQPGETGGRRGRRMEFTLGDGGARVTAGAFSGSITIRRGSAAGDRE